MIPVIRLCSSNTEFYTDQKKKVDVLKRQESKEKLESNVFSLTKSQ